MFFRIIILLGLFVFLPTHSFGEDTRLAEPGKGDDRAGESIAPGLELYFFLDPDGRPCQMQDAILKEMGADLSSKAQVKYISTSVASDRELFYRYGVRGLPMLLLADASGNVVARMPPGVKDADTIRTLIRSHSGF